MRTARHKATLKTKICFAQRNPALGRPSRGGVFPCVDHVVEHKSGLAKEADMVCCDANVCFTNDPPWVSWRLERDKNNDIYT